jgi:hypothetical protein
MADNMKVALCLHGLFDSTTDSNSLGMNGYMIQMFIFIVGKMINQILLIHYILLKKLYLKNNLILIKL